jgi:tRNA uridine 5-carboxymethylaminomethyl modification enzyme
MMTEPFNPQYDVIVIGAGHAGCEASYAAARMGVRSLLLTIDLDKIAQMSCNPSIGGPAKSQLVQEIDALGGLMGHIIDQSFIQIRMLNESKGPAVQSVRAQADKRLYSRLMKEALEMTPNLHIRQAMVEQIIPRAEAEAGALPEGYTMPDDPSYRFAVVTHLGQVYFTRTLIVTTGTFLRGRLITGATVWQGGRAGEPPAMSLSESLAALGFPLVRLKTGTPPRIDARSIDFDQTEVQPGSITPLSFGFYYPDRAGMESPPSFPLALPPNPVYPSAMLNSWRAQLPCYMVHTTPEFHQLVRDNLDRAPLFSGIIEGVGPRYCPSIEDKIVRFADKDRHLLFLEPEGWNTCEVYIQGCNTSLPEDVQWAMIRSIPAMRQAEFLRIGYAIEYDAVVTGEITADLNTRRHPGLFLAGQINGTTGYEEAAAQGVIAGINAVRFLRGEPSVILRRDEAYIGVLIDDLVTKDIREPYRMFTSRAEHRLLLRGNNADLRLTPLAYTLGLVDEARAAAVQDKQQHSEQLQSLLRSTRLFPNARTNASLVDAGLPTISSDVTAEGMLRRPEVSYERLQQVVELPDYPPYVVEQVEHEAIYGEYIIRQKREAERVRKMEHRRIPGDFDYEAIKGLRAEARQLLLRFRPATLGQASRLAGVNPSDVAIVLMALERREQREG